jgi:hypothetical protein
MSGGYPTALMPLLTLLIRLSLLALMPQFMNGVCLLLVATIIDNPSFLHLSISSTLPR